jgi:PAS domain S-box-containing protein
MLTTRHSHPKKRSTLAPTPSKSEDFRFQLFLQIAEAVSEAADFNSALAATLEGVCAALGWDHCEAWVPNSAGEILEFRPVCCATREGLRPFRLFSEGVAFGPGIGLPGRVWASRQPEWIADISAVPENLRFQIAKEAGLKTSLGIPVMAGGRVVAVLVFWAFELRKEDKAHIETISMIASHLGPVLELKRAEHALRESEGRLRAIVDTSTRIIYLKDREGRYLLVNRQYEKLFHLSAEQIAGKTDHDIFPKELADAYRANDLKTIEAGVPLEFEEQVMQDDGLHVYSSNKFPLRNSAGVLYAVCGISMDITERKRAEEIDVRERARAETWLQTLIEATQDGVVSIDRAGRIKLFNRSAEKIFGYATGEVQGQKIGLLMAEPYASEHEDYIARYERTGERRVIGRIRTVAARRKNGDVFPAELSVTEVATEGDIRYTAFVRDISEKSKLQDRLIESERLAAIGATAAKLAHEIGNPLNSMSLTAQLLERHLGREGAGLDGPAKSTLRRLTDEISRLSNLLHEFSSLSRRDKYSLRPTSLAAVTKEVVELERSRCAALGIRVEQVFPPDLPFVQADGDKLKQAILNLIKNSTEAMPRGGALTLRAREAGGEVLLEIFDSGVGIPDGVDVFEPFVTTKESGTGLGLVIVRQIISAHGGAVSYSSERGKGTVFRVTFPLTPSAPTA